MMQKGSSALAKTILERVLERLGEKNISMAEFGLLVAKNKSFLSSGLKQGSVPGGEVLCKMSNVLGVSVDWLLGLAQDMQPVSRPVVIDFKHIGSVPDEGTSELAAVPILRDPTAAGPGRVIQDKDIEGIGIIYTGWCPHPEQTDYVRVKGDSMLPTIPDGSLVTIDKAEATPEKLIGHVVAIWLAESEEVTIKRLQYDKNRRVYKGIPDNITEDNLPFDLTSRDKIIGSVRSVHALISGSIKRKLT